MGFLTAVAEQRHTVSYETILGNFKSAALARLWSGGQETASGVRVDETTALWSTAYYCGVRILAESVAQLPLVVYERGAGGRRTRVDSHPLSHRLHFMPNDDMTSFDWRESGMGHILTWGNHYSHIDRSKGGDVLELVPLHPSETRAKRVAGGKLIYVHTHGSDPPVPFDRDEILHIHGLGFDGISGYSPVGLHAQSIGLGLALQEYAARLFGNNASPSGVIEHPGKSQYGASLGPASVERMRTSWELMHRGLENSHRVAILEEGAVYKPISFAPKEAQSIEARTFQVHEVARILRVPPHMLSELSRATFSNIEEQSLEFVIYSLMPWLVRWEQAISARLFLPSERSRFYAKFNVDGLLRGDIESRYKAYAIGRTNGWLSGDEIRQLEEQNEMPDGLGQHYMIQGAMVPIQAAIAAKPPALKAAPDPVDDPEPDPEPEPDAKDAKRALLLARGSIADAHVPVFRDALERLLKWEVRGVLRLVKKGPPDMDGALREFYTQHQGAIAGTILPAVRSLAVSIKPGVDMDGFVVSYSEEMGRRRSDCSMRQVTTTAILSINSRVAGWESDGCADAAIQEVQTLIEKLAGSGPEEV